MYTLLVNLIFVYVNSNFRKNCRLQFSISLICISQDDLDKLNHDRCHKYCDH